MTWTCSVCTYANPLDQVQCLMCETPSAGPTQTWICSACTFASNPSIASVCTVCETPRNITSTPAVTSSFSSTIPSFTPTLTSISSNTSTTSSTSHTSHDSDSDTPLSARLPSRLRKRLSMSSTSATTSAEHDVTDKALPMFSMDFLTICMLHKKLSIANDTANAPTTTTTSTSSSPPTTTKSGGLLSKVFGKKRGSTSSSSPPAPTPPTPININKGMKDVETSSDRKQAMRVLNELYQHVEYKKENTKHRPISTCQICYCDFTGDVADASGDPDDDDVLRVKMTTCGHSMICADCMHQYCWKRIEEETVIPWLPCPAEECSAPIHPSDLHTAGLSTLELLSMARIVMSKKICRNQNWVSCPTPRCVYGFIQMGKPLEQTLQCSLCNQSHKIEKGKQLVDDEMKKMLDAGTLRKCPKCDQITLKEKGICNVIECAKCGIWWNWRTRETAKDSRSLKNMARNRGTLWEPGELRYQQQLEQSDPEAFKALLERNGMEYDPNYVRGT